MILSEDGETAVILPAEIFQWANELAWEQVQQDQQRTVTGALVVDQFVQVSGRPITIAPTPGGGWLTREEWAQIDAWRHTAGLVLTLTLDDEDETQLSVIFDRPAMEAEPVRGYTGRTDAEFWTGSIKLLEV
jgi:hypothetical protein